VALLHEPPTVAEGWAQVLQVDGTAERVHDAALSHAEQLERAARAPSKAAWKLISAKILPALAMAQPGEGVPPEVEKHLKALVTLMKGQSIKASIDVAKIGTKIEGQAIVAWDKIVAKAIGADWTTAPNGALVSSWAQSTAGSVDKITTGLVPGLRAAIVAARAKGWTAAELEQHLRANGLPLAGGGTAEGKASTLAKGKAAELATQATQAAQKAAGCDQYEWGPTTSKNPDPEHAARRGHRYRWSDPPPDGHPGERHGCHCTAKPAISPAEAKALKASLEPKVPKPVTLPPSKPKPVPTPVPMLPVAKVKSAPVTQVPAPTSPPAPPPKSKGRMVPPPASWAIARELEAKAKREATEHQRRKLEALIAEDQPVHDPKGPKVDAKGSSKAAKTWGKTLTADQLDAIKDWSEDGFGEMRAADGGILGGRPEKMRNMSHEMYIHRRAQLNEVRKALRSPHAPRHEGVLYRGLTLPQGVPDAKAYFEMLTTKGNEFQLESLSSWSHNKSVSKNQFSRDVEGGLLVKIRKSTRGVPINAAGLSSFGSSEGEVLLDKGSRYRVVKISREKGDQHRQVVELEEID
jgi:SPP1 gp7 family putative phage head morphogenesis protein